MAGVHGLQHVEGLGAADLTDQDPVGPHPQRVADQLPDGQLALALHVGRAVLERDHVRVLDLKLGGVLDRHHALVLRDVGGHHVERGGLAGAGAPGDEDVHPAQHAGPQEVGHRR